MLSIPLRVFAGDQQGGCTNDQAVFQFPCGYLRGREARDNLPARALSIPLRVFEVEGWRRVRVPCSRPFNSLAGIWGGDCNYRYYRYYTAFNSLAGICSLANFIIFFSLLLLSIPLRVFDDRRHVEGWPAHPRPFQFPCGYLPLKSSRASPPDVSLSFQFPCGYLPGNRPPRPLHRFNSFNSLAGICLRVPPLGLLVGWPAPFNSLAGIWGGMGLRCFRQTRLWPFNSLAGI